MTGYDPLNVAEELVKDLLFGLIDSMGDLQSLQIGLCEVIVSKLLIDVFDEIGIPDQIPRRDSIFISQIADFLLCEIDA